MARNGVRVKGRRRRVNPRDEDSEESDEEYKVTEDEECDESDESFSYDSDESEAEFAVSRKVSKSRNTRRSSSGRKRNEMIKSRKKRRIIYKEDDVEEEEEEVDDEDFMSFGRKTNQIKKPAEKKRDSYTEKDDIYNGSGNDNENNVDDDGGDYDDGDYDDDEDGDDDDDYAKVAPAGRNKNSSNNRKENKRVVNTEDDDEEDDDDDAEIMPRRKRNIRNYPKEKKRVVYTEDDDDDEDDDGDEEFMYSGMKVNEKKNLRKKRKVSYTEDDEDDLELLSTSKKDNQIKEEPITKTDVSYTDGIQEDEDEKDAEFMISESEFLADEDDSEFMSTSENRNHIEEPQENMTVSYEEDDKEEEEDEKDAEFKLSESDFNDDDEDDEDETFKMKKSEKISRPRPQKKTVRVCGGRKNKSLKRKRSSHSKQRNRKLGQKLDKNQTENRNKKTSKKRKQSVMGDSDSDFVNSPSFDHEFTISEEEREQMREASVYCANLRAKLRSSSNGNQEQQPEAYEERKYPIRKGKEKVEVGKQVCGICLSEEAKRTVRGVLNCCQHYFCFSCIMEWSKVESRCPLCKQRFTTITKSAKSDTGFDLRTIVIPVPECDQVYQPSEEELRGYLDPYESVMCTECHNGGDDALMLLCDICDSPAHTFCVGLGHEVPEGNWYCEGCRPSVFGTLNSQCPTPTSADRRSSSTAGGFDLNELYVPETPLSQQSNGVPEPIPGFNATSNTSPNT
ncbi:uncharacterized protein [Rutidosis leptorrhynchoides]|uniref:uncharacterized protein n=1 Tax=Rutidosis leptorrhynchoides TaxID=125765 RepID=UPI003A995645